ncbi:uncharacterized protein LOC132305542 isoform X2 [Cornus florida]|uniref:uncharacterized protein LOC132305542 isoform X2 n=1 Tax=Cornus florida TaxID=4283 RepID=UPI0028971C8E|nr:uncharacterized protein LOC132305542 isoform X2 [Cornus florida]
MSFLYMGFSCESDFDKESLIPVIDETRETRLRGGMDVHQNGFQSEVEFWPVEHPIEPLDEDRPVKCPMPDSSIINDGQIHEERFPESLRKRTEQSAVVNKEGMMVMSREPPVRAVRKRHHTLTRRDQTITPLLRMPPLHPLPAQNVTIFQMLQHFDKFQS